MSVVKFIHPSKVNSEDPDLLAEVMEISPDDATRWLQCNKLTRSRSCADEPW